ncbi:hypothetical protein [Streptomyces sp. MNP-20]|uniref:hypothetical protein n=1 Tax=Streptomyces sp. MNP-20 TaxID=2721165 RepID=UPI001556CBA6|nr:hypothetical protein [Streptomyces sp. MNP-20]
MSDGKLSVVPSNPHWQPDRDAADRAAAVVRSFALGGRDTVKPEVSWHDTAVFVDCGANLEKIECPRCEAPLDIGWWADQMGTHGESGFADLMVTVPCCGAHTSLNDLNYDWPCGFAQFEITVRNPQRDWFNDREIALVAEALGQPVRQVKAHV